MALPSARLHFWQGPRLFMWKNDAQNRKDLLAADQAPADDGEWHWHDEILLEFYATHTKLSGVELHYTNLITQLLTEAFSIKDSWQKLC